MIYDIRGGAYFLEDGVEIGNKFRYNLAIYVRTSSSLLNEDVTPAAFWATNPNNTYEHNAVAGSTHFGWWYRILDRSDGPSYNPNYCPKKMPMGKFFNNSVHTAGRFGIWIFPGYTPSVTGSCWDSNPSVAKFENFYTYGCDMGAEYVVSNFLQFKSLVAFDHFSAGMEIKTITFNENANTQYAYTFYNENIGSLISDSIIVGNSQTSSSRSITPTGIIVAWDRGLLVKNVSFYNFPDTSSQAIVPPVIAGRCSEGCGGWTTKFTGLSFTNVRYKTTHRWNWDGVYHDLDGSLTGVANGVVVSYNNITQASSSCQASDSFRNGIVCSDTQEWVRFAFNNFVPDYVALINITNVNNQMATSPRLRKRLTHPFGYMTALEANQEYLLELDQAFAPTNISYTGTFYGIYPGDYLIIKHRLSEKPDRVYFSNSFLIGNESSFPLNYSNVNGDWFFDNDTSILSYILSNKYPIRPFLDLPIQFSAFKCRYVGCVPPTQPPVNTSVSGRPSTALYWSKLSTWTILDPTSNSLPADYTDVTIPATYYVVLGKIFKFQLIIK